MPHLLKPAIALSLLGGYVLGKAGNAVFGGETAKKAYTTVATGAFIAKDAVMEQVEKIQVSAADIAADAKINAERYYAKRDAEAAVAEDDLTVDEILADVAEDEA